MRRHDVVIGAMMFVRAAPGGYDDEHPCSRHSPIRRPSPSTTPGCCSEIEARNTELAESLELQTATSEILRLISANPGDLTRCCTESSTRAAALCDAEGGPLCSVTATS